MALPLLPGTEKQYQQLRALMAEGSFVALVAGPPGSGKRTLISRVAEEAGLRTHDFDIESAGMSAAELRAMIAKRLSASQITPDATLWTNIVWVVHNAELLDAHAAVWKSDVTQGLRIILKVHDAPPKLREALKPIYFDRVTDARVAAWAREHLPDADAARIAKMAGGDLRQARAAADMPTGGKDRAGHVHFDTLALVNGGAPGPAAGVHRLGASEHARAVHEHRGGGAPERDARSGGHHALLGRRGRRAGRAGPRGRHRAGRRPHGARPRQGAIRQGRQEAEGDAAAGRLGGAGLAAAPRPARRRYAAAEETQTRRPRRGHRAKR